MDDMAAACLHIGLHTTATDLINYTIESEFDELGPRVSIGVQRGRPADSGAGGRVRAALCWAFVEQNSPARGTSQFQANSGRQPGTASRGGTHPCVISK